jgi:esterase/lipase superfamily enzyme
MLPPGTVAAPRGGASAGGTSTSAPATEGADYWIVSSRQCKGRTSGHNGCLVFLHRTADRKLTDRGREAFLSSIRADQPVCFVVHGSYNWWNDVVNESQRINRWIRSASPASSVQVVFFTWPSDGNMPYLFPVDIAVLGRKASQHSLYLANLIGKLPPEQPVCLLGHSHGARASVAALHLLGGGAIEDGEVLAPGYSTPRRLRAVLVAAAIDRNWLNPGQRYGQALQVPEQVLLMRNSRDATLAIYPLRKAGSGRALGRDGLALEDRFALDRMGKKVVELDAAQFAGLNHSFADYHEHPELAAAITPYVYFQDGTPSAASAEPVPTTTARPDSALGNPEPINPPEQPPAGEPARDGAPLNGPTTPAGNRTGPKLVPTSLPPISDEDFPPASEDARSAEEPRGEENGFRFQRIFPRARNAAESTAPANGSAAGQTGNLPAGKTDGKDGHGHRLPEQAAPRKPRKRNPFHLRLER